MEYYCGIDLGTSSVKVMLLGADGTVVGTASAGYDIQKKYALGGRTGYGISLAADKTKHNSAA